MRQQVTPQKWTGTPLTFPQLDIITSNGAVVRARMGDEGLKQIE